MQKIIVKRRKELGYTQQQLAEQLNVSDKVISKWETGKSLPDTSMLLSLAKALQISVNDLLSDNMENQRKIEQAAQLGVTVKYKNLFIIVMAMQLIAAVFLCVGRVLYDQNAYYGKDISEVVYYLLYTLAFLIEVFAIVFYLIARNNLISKYPTSVLEDKKYINRLLFCTYLLVLAVIVVFIVLHGLSTFEQLITLVIAALVALLFFLVLYFINLYRKL